MSTGITYDVEIEGRRDEDDLRALIEHVDAIAEIPTRSEGAQRSGLAAVS